MRSFASASSQYIQAEAGVLSTTPITMCCWARPLTLTATMTAIAQGVSNEGRYMALGYLSTGKVFCEVVGSTTNALPESATAVSKETLNHILFIETSATNRAVYLNGAAGTTNTASIGTHTGLNRVTIGCLFQNNLRTSYFNGQIGDAAIWNVGLNASEITALAKGADPRLVRPGALLFYAPMLIGASPEQDIWRALKLELAAAGAAPTMSVLAPPVMRARGMYVADPPSEVVAAKSLVIPPFTARNSLLRR